MMDRALRILVVDDEPDILETLEYSLEKRGYEVATALDGLEGLDKAKRMPPDFMILDVMLPGCNGYEVSRMLKEWMENDPEAKSFPIMLLPPARWTPMTGRSSSPPGPGPTPVSTNPSNSKRWSATSPS